MSFVISGHTSKGGQGEPGASPLLGGRELAWPKFSLACSSETARRRDKEIAGSTTKGSGNLDEGFVGE